MVSYLKKDINAINRIEKKSDIESVLDMEFYTSQLF